MAAGREGGGHCCEARFRVNQMFELGGGGKQSTSVHKCASCESGQRTAAGRHLLFVLHADKHRIIDYSEGNTPSLKHSVKGIHRH